MKSEFIFIMIAFIFSCSDNKSKHEILSFEVRLAELNPVQNFVEMTIDNSDMKFFVDDSIFLQNADIISVDVLDWETHPKVLVNLTGEGRKKFADFTQQNIGKNAAILVGGKLVSAPKINAPINDGKLIIVGFFTHEETLQIADGISPNQ